MWCLLMSDVQKVELASLYTVCKAETWYMAICLVGRMCSGDLSS